jgi:hypothetical protein
LELILRKVGESTMLTLISADFEREIQDVRDLPILREGQSKESQTFLKCAIYSSQVQRIRFLLDQPGIDVQCHGEYEEVSPNEHHLVFYSHLVGLAHSRTMERNFTRRQRPMDIALGYNIDEEIVRLLFHDGAKPVRTKIKANSKAESPETSSSGPNH